MYKVVFLLTPEFSLTNVSTAVDTLRVANTLLPQPRYKWLIASDTERAVPSSCGLTIAAEIDFQEVEDFDLLLVCGSFKPQQYVKDQTQRRLRRFARYGKFIGSMEAGAYHLALSGAFDGHSVTAHYANLPVYAKLFPNVSFVSNVFTFAEKRVSCAGGLSSLDLMLHLIKTDLGINVAIRCANLLQAPLMRDEKESQSGLMVLSDGKLPTSIHDACRFMEQHIENPISIEQIAKLVGLSRRQLDRLFERYFSDTASDIYMTIRLSRARKLLRSTRLDLVAISDACGFGSYPNFSRAYRKMFGWSPTRERRQPSGDSNKSMRLMPAFDLHPDQTQYAPDKLL
ncbi:GlxA family transcriptional regulator [Rhizobium sp.]|uniref:GlxA family transcriptional regulator n=1 Tax=Rhizobium sp. TaxID=391 RepID=UPI0028AD2D61